MGVITYNGISSSEYGILVEHPPGYHIPERDYEYIHVPGRNGDLLIDKGSYLNSTRTYEIAFGDDEAVLYSGLPILRREKVPNTYPPAYSYSPAISSITGPATAWIGETYHSMAAKVARWLHSASGYARLEDTYDPDHFMLASYVNEVDIENVLAHAGRAEIEFNCKPQRYLKSGEDTVYGETGSATYGESRTYTFRNRPPFPALPYIKISGTGTLNLLHNGVVRMRLTNVSEYIEIDCELQNVYKGNENLNANASIMNGTDFYKFIPSAAGNVIITVTPANSSSSVTGLEIIPRWWEL